MRVILTILFFVAFSLPLLLNAQTISGTIKTGDETAIGANIVSDPGGAGTVTNNDGQYKLKLKPGTYTVTVSYVGYSSKSKKFTLAEGDNVTWDATLASAVIDEVVIVGTRTAPRSSTTTPLPIDVVGVKELANTGQNSFDKALTYKVPSFNSVQTPVNDATSLLDPYEIRNMGPSRTLVLINGKRKNMSALLYTQTSPGRGETGADISGIPQDMIKRVEILRDGASAQYGSDAIAGVMNIILKDNTDDGYFTVRTGASTNWDDRFDGQEIGLSLNNGATFGEDRGFLNYTVDLSKRALANRPGMVDAEGEAGDFGADIADVQKFLDAKPDAGNINGSPETAAAKFGLNGGLEINENAELYGNGAYVYKKVNSFANYRTPYWRTLDAFPYLENFFGDQFGYEDLDNNGVLDYAGYVPTFDGDLIDYNGTLGLRVKKGEWTTDLSFTVGSNEQTYIVRNSHNRSDVLNADGSNKYRESSQLVFDPGGTRFDHIVGNIDITRRFSDMIGIAFGSEFRSETFTVIEGALSSYEGGGPDSFAGNDARNSGQFNRYNFGGYADIALDLTDDFLINLTGRLEDYSDFGLAAVWKASTRYKLMEDQMTLRASASTGFKAPTLHQIFTQKAQYSFAPGGGIQVGGLISNVSREARLLGLPSLEPEKSTNITVGLGFRPKPNISFTVDYYNIAVKDRIILSTQIGATDAGDTQLDDVLRENNLADLSFFVNALDTRTSGIDFVGSYTGINLGPGTLGANLAGNYTIQNEREGDVKNPDLVAAAGQSVANVTQEALFFTSRPRYKAILGLNYQIGKLGIALNNTLFGPTHFRNDGLDTRLSVDFVPKIVTDLGFAFQANEQVSLAFNVNNLLNVLPEWEFNAVDDADAALLNDAAFLKNQSNLITFNQRYPVMTYDGYHFSQLGTLFNLSLTVKL